MKPLNLRPASNSDLNVIDQLCQLSWHNQKQWVGYPRVQHLEELQGVVNEFDNQFHHCIMVIELEGQIVGFTGLLYKEGDHEAHIVGPVLLEKYHTIAFYKIVIEEVVSKCLNTFETVHIEVALINKILLKAIDENKWTTATISPSNMSIETQTFSLNLERALTL
ncbi:hypothetical protein [Alkalibacillus silvisoli]|uniref:GNAT family N-acetyltransferase n=1 Tax=Alkalibacillus silvisoli TaxID=392823 RepID=A0ABP3JVP7_9BACI